MKTKIPFTGLNAISMKGLLIYVFTSPRLLLARMMNRPRDGVYFLVLMDLVGSTGMMMNLGEVAGIQKILRFTGRLRYLILTKNYEAEARFVKEIGDAGLMAFRKKEDVYRFLQHWNIENRIGESFPVRTVVHKGQVYFDGTNPISIEVSRLFKMEKMAHEGEVLWSESASGQSAQNLSDQGFSFGLRSQVE